MKIPKKYLDNFADKNPSWIKKQRWFEEFYIDISRDFIQKKVNKFGKKWVLEMYFEEKLV